MAGVAEGLRVIDLSWGSAGPMTTMLLADHGADVIRVERPGGARFGPVEGERVWHRGKRSAVLDLTAPGDRTVLTSLVAGADVLVESFRPGVTQRLGIGYEQLVRLNPGLVYCSITGYGRGTRLADRPGYDALVAARCGLQWEARGWYGSPMHRVLGLDAPSADVQPSAAIAIGSDRDGPIFPATAAPSVGAAYLATLGISSALVARQRTGRGQLVETSLMQGVLMTNAAGWQRPEHVDAPGYYASVQDRRQTWSVLRAADGWVCMWASPLDWVTLAGSGDTLVLPDRQRIAEIRSQRGAAVSIEDRLARLEEAAPIVKKFPVAAWVELAAELGDVSCQPVRTPEEALCDPLLLAEGSVIELLEPDLGVVRQAGCLFRLHARPVTINRAAPQPGQHTVEVKKEATDGVASKPATGDGSTLRGPLDGVKIVDFGLAVAGPWASQVLADLGADVIKVDPPRQAGWLATNMAISVNRSKRSICIDMKSPGGSDVAYDLVRWADVVIFNMRPQAAAKLGLDYETVAEVNPSVVYCHTRGFDDSPRSLLPGNDQTANALAGTLWEDGGCSNGGRPWFGSTSNGDLGNGFLAAIAIVQALYDRQRTGKGQRVDSSIVNAGLFNNSRVMTTPEGATFERRHLDADQTGLSALYRIYRCADEWLCLAVITEDHWRNLVTAIPALDGDGRFATAADRQKHDDDLAGVLSSAFASKDAAQWFETLDRAGVPCEISDSTFSQTLFDDSELLERQWVVRLEGDHPVGRIDMVGIGIDFSDTPSRVVGPPPRMWRDTRAVLQDLGYDEARIDALFESGAARSDQ
jgi:crotonobetainyl-CoA:carnitine CoA-transferase CaiB-like acyl-CoA transferase